MARLIFFLLSVFLSFNVALADKHSLKDIKAVDGFDLNRYLGKWYEIARLDNRFERGMSNNTAKYTLRDDGSMQIINRGFIEKKNKWKEVKGKAHFYDDKQVGHLRVSFFWPFYGSYIVFGLDDIDYNYAFVAGDGESYLWLLARSPLVDQSVVDRFIEQSADLGFDTDALIFVDHNTENSAVE